MATTRSVDGLQALWADAPTPRDIRVHSESRYLTMRDGTRLAVDLMRPQPAAAEGRLPALLILTRYWRSLDLWFPDRPGRALIGPRESTPDFFLARGFAVVVVDGRGTGASTGVSRAPFAPEEIDDYGEVAAWVASQPWCNGRVGAYGISYEGATALRLIASGRPAVGAVIAQEIEYDVYADVIMPGGVLNEAFLRAWSESNQALDRGRPSRLFPWLARLVTRGVRPVDADRPARRQLAQALREHESNTDVFAAVSGLTYRDDAFGASGLSLDDLSLGRYETALAAAQVPIFSWASWLDGATAEAALRTFRANPGPQTVVIGAWKHEMTRHASPFVRAGSPPDPAQPRQWEAMARFFQRTLQAGEPLTERVIHYVTLGAEAWRTTSVFPPPGTHLQPWYLGAQGSLIPEGPGLDGADDYRVDFEASTGRRNRWQTQMARPVEYPDRAAADRRLLCYTSAPLAQDLEVTGYPQVTLHVTTSLPDGAFFVYLEDVDPAGVVRYVTEGQLRGIHRTAEAETHAGQPGAVPVRPTFLRADAAPLPVGEPVAMTIGLQPTSVLFRRGHRIRVALAGADRDTFARVPTDGQPVWQVWHGAARPSALWLPVA